MSPREFESARASESETSYVIKNRPYFPKLHGYPDNNESIFNAASSIVFYPESPPDDLHANLSLSKVSGGITNSLFRVSGFPSPHPNSVLVRIFGAEGMIDRDLETTAYASLCDAGIAYKYHGRFANGRVEGWLEGYRALNNLEMGDMVSPIASALAKLHATYHGDGDEEVTLWNQLFGWFEQASTSVSNGTFLDENDCAKAAELLEGYDILNELNHMKKDVVPSDSKTCNCHNDLLAANIMKSEDGHIQLIDFEYGGYNFLAFDIANHFNEYAGGTEDAKPDYSLYPSPEKQEEFIKSYFEAYSKYGGEGLELKDLMIEVEAFALVNNLYWGLWAVNQAASEGCNEFNYLLYAENRFKRYRDCRK